MTIAAPVRCTVCGGTTRVRADAVRQRCDFCGAEFLYQATHAAAGDAERRLAAALAAVQPHLDALDQEARGRAAAGDLAGAHRVVADHTRRVGALYQGTGYYRLMGVETPVQVEQNLGLAYSMHLQRLGIPAAANAPRVSVAPIVPGTDQMTQALGRQDFDGALAGYGAMVKHQVDHDVRWANRDPSERAQIVASAIRTFALGLPWARPEDFARHRIDVPCVTRRADGSASVTCTHCGAEVVLGHLAESITCTYCSATFRIRLEGVDVYHARGYLDVTAEDVARQRAAEGAARGDIGARIELGRQSAAGQAPPGSVRERELTFSYAVMMGAPLSADQLAAMANGLGLGTPRKCKSCESAIAIAPESRQCPLCTTKTQ